MVEIPIQRKPRRKVWPIVLLLLIIAAIVAWYLWSRSATTTTTPATNDTTATPRPTSMFMAPPAHMPAFKEVRNVA